MRVEMARMITIVLSWAGTSKVSMKIAGIVTVRLGDHLAERRPEL